MKIEQRHLNAAGTIGLFVLILLLLVAVVYIGGCRRWERRIDRAERVLDTTEDAIDSAERIKDKVTPKKAD